MTNFKACMAGVLMFSTLNTFAQVRGGPPQTPKAMAPADLTGYWDVVEDWRYRMLPPIRNSSAGSPRILQFALKYLF